MEGFKFNNAADFMANLVKYFNYEINATQLLTICMFLERNKNIDYQSLYFCIVENEKFFPSIPTLKKYIDGSVEDSDRSILAVGNIFKAIKNNGWRAATNSCLIGQFEEDIVNNFGGWESLGLSQENDTILRSQMVKTGTALIRQFKANEINDMILIDGTQQAAIE